MMGPGVFTGEPAAQLSVSAGGCAPVARAERRSTGPGPVRGLGGDGIRAKLCA